MKKFSLCFEWRPDLLPATQKEKECSCPSILIKILNQKKNLSKEC